MEPTEDVLCPERCVGYFGEKKRHFLFELDVVRQLFWGPYFGTLDSAFEFE